MKRLSLFAILLVVGAGVSFAITIGVPWFVDTADPGSGYPPSAGTMSVIYLHNNTASIKTCQIEYFSGTGIDLNDEPGREGGGGGTFNIAANATIAFRPVKFDPTVAAGGIAGGQEDAAGILVPDRPRFGTGDTNKQNGSCVIRYFGEATDVQGMLLTITPAMSYAHLLPGGG